MAASAATASRLIAAAAVRLAAVRAAPAATVGRRGGDSGGAPPGGSGDSPTARPAGATASAAAPTAVLAPVSAIAVNAAPVAQGQYNPLTLDVGVVVDGFAASMWEADVAPNMAAAALAPARAFCGRLGGGRSGTLAAGHGGRAHASGPEGAALVLVW